VTLGGSAGKRGRPARASEPAGVRVTIRLTRPELREIRELIGRMPVSQWMRSVALRAVRRPR